LSRRHTKEIGKERRGIGLYTYEQAKNTSPFQFFAQIIVGTIVILVGGLFFYHALSVRADEIRHYGAAEMHLWNWVGSLAIVVIGLFMAHAGLIFYARRLLRRLSRSTGQSAHRNGDGAS